MLFTPLFQSKLPKLKLYPMGLQSKLPLGHRWTVSYRSSYRPPLTGEFRCGEGERREAKGEGPRLAAMAASPAAMAASLMDPLATVPSREARLVGREDATGERLRPRRLVMTPGEGDRREDLEVSTVETSFI